MTKDFLGNQVDVGDYVFYSTTDRYPESRVCRISRFTAKSMFGVILKTNRGSYRHDEEVLIRNDFVKIPFTPKEPK